MLKMRWDGVCCGLRHWMLSVVARFARRLRSAAASFTARRRPSCSFLSSVCVLSSDVRAVAAPATAFPFCCRSVVLLAQADDPKHAVVLSSVRVLHRFSHGLRSAFCECERLPSPVPPPNTLPPSHLSLFC